MSLSVQFCALKKSFGQVEVLHGVNFSLAAGRIYGLLGENGAGKSTLVKILAGYEIKSTGQILVNEKEVNFANSLDAENAGIVLIHQEFNLAEPLTIAQNIFLGQEIVDSLGFLDEKTMNFQAEKALAEVGFNQAPTKKIRELIVAEKQLVEIAKAISRNAQLLIMDEPTATLTPSETERLFLLMRRLKKEGVTIIYISHKLDEVEFITDEIIVMRDGDFVSRAKTSETSRAQMANLMVGRELADLYPLKQFPEEKLPIFEVANFSVPKWAKNVSFAVQAGEVFGFAGLVGAGRTELFEAILGLRPKTSGEILINQQSCTIKNPQDAVKNGLTYLSEDRKGKGLHVNFGLSDNLTLLDLQRYAKPWLNKKAEQQALAENVAEFGIRAGSLEVKAAALSGGNQQKLALAKFLHPSPKIIVLDEPTRGVDVGAKSEIYALIKALAQSGRAVIVISSELVELIGICHRVGVMRQGQLQTILSHGQLSEKVLIAHATGTLETGTLEAETLAAKTLKTGV